jgi:hypothetical protein
VATGFFGGERAGDAYLLRAGDAHAWAQVWVNGRGFIDVDATPESGRAAQAPAALAWIVRQYEVIDAWWRGTVIDYSIGDQVRLAKKVVAGPQRRSRSAPASPPNAWIAAGVIALGAYSVWRAWLFLRSRTTPLESTRLREAAEALLARAGIEPERGEGFEEFVARIAALGRSELTPALHAVARRYLEARFGGRDLDRNACAELTRKLRAALREDWKRKAA